MEVLLELFQPGRVGERLVVAVKREDDVGPRVREFKPVLADRCAGVELVRLRNRGVAGKPLVLRAKIHRPHAAVEIAIAVHLVAAVAQVAEHQVVLRIASVNQRLEPTGMLHPLGQRVADQADVVSLAKFERRRSSGGLREARVQRQGQRPKPRLNA